MTIGSSDGQTYETEMDQALDQPTFMPPTGQPGKEDMKEMGAEMLSRLKGKPSYEGRLKALDEYSGATEDRRGDVDDILKKITDFNMDEWKKMLSHPITPFWELFPERFGREPPDPELKEGQLTEDIGLKDIAKGQLLKRVVPTPSILPFSAPPPKIDRNSEIPFISGPSKDGKTIYIDKKMPYSPLIDQGLTQHELWEKWAMDILTKKGYSDEEAYQTAHHQIAEPIEDAYYKSQGVSVGVMNKFYKKQDRRDEAENVDLPKDLFIKPYVGKGKTSGDTDESAQGNVFTTAALDPDVHQILSDADPQNFKAWQQYAMEETRQNVPEMGIRMPRGEGGFAGGGERMPTGRFPTIPRSVSQNPPRTREEAFSRVENILSDMQGKATTEPAKAGMNIKLQRIGSRYGSDQYDLHVNDERVGQAMLRPEKVTIREKEGLKDYHMVHVDWVDGFKSGATPTERIQAALAFKKAVAEQYPEAVAVAGTRISGVKGGKQDALQLIGLTDKYSPKELRNIFYPRGNPHPDTTPSRRLLEEAPQVSREEASQLGHPDQFEQVPYDPPPRPGVRMEDIYDDIMRAARERANR